MRDPGALRISPIDTRAILHLKTWNCDRTTPSFFAPRAKGECRLLELTDGEWLLISDTISGEKLHEFITPQVQEQGVTAVNVSQGLAALQLEGFAVRDVFAKSCGLDLHPQHFPVGSCTRTRFALLSVVIDYIDVKPRFELYVGRSYLSYLMSWLTDAAVEFHETSIEVSRITR
jgi:heterotetrameric sarcosine oxidase gamma subunit